ncbi:MAG: O-antigen ligase family protein [Spirochaetia bacterium]|nr:O-antigen ligase family protein [Spirochaetia bacterium]
MQIIIFALFIFLTYKTKLFHENIKDLKPVYYSLFSFLGFAAFQILPLPPSFIAFLSPTAHKVYIELIPDYFELYSINAKYKSLSLYSYATKAELLKYTAYFLSFYILTKSNIGRKRLKLYLYSLITLAMIETLIGLYAYFSANLVFDLIFDKNTQVSGTYVNRNHFAGLLGMILPLGINLLIYNFLSYGDKNLSFKERIMAFLSSKKGTKNTIYFIFIVLIFMGIIASHSRMGIFSCIFSIFITASLWISSGKKKTTQILIGIFISVMAITLWMGIQPLEDRFSKMSENFSVGRQILWQSTINLINDYKFFGAGFGVYEHILRHYVPVDFPGRLTFINHAHNDYLELLSSGGFIGSLLLLMANIYFFKTIMVNRHYAYGLFAKSMIIGGTSSIAYIFMHSFSDFNLQIPANAFILTIIYSITYSASKIRK